MDIYLPADFLELHAAAPDDWRDASSSAFAHEHAGAEPVDARECDHSNACADPLWRVI